MRQPTVWYERLIGPHPWERGGTLRQLLLLVASGVVVVVALGSIYGSRLAARSTATNLSVIGAELTDVGAFGDAVDVLKKAAYLNPNDPYVFYELGNAFHGAGDDADAALAWNRAFSLDPSIRGMIQAANENGPGNTPLNLEPRERLLQEAEAQWERKWSIFGGPTIAPAQRTKANSGSVRDALPSQLISTDR